MHVINIHRAVYDPTLGTSACGLPLLEGWGVAIACLNSNSSKCEVSTREERVQSKKHLCPALLCQVPSPRGTSTR